MTQRISELLKQYVSDLVQLYGNDLKAVILSCIELYENIISENGSRYRLNRSIQIERGCCKIIWTDDFATPPSYLKYNFALLKRSAQSSGLKDRGCRKSQMPPGL